MSAATRAAVVALVIAFGAAAPARAAAPIDVATFLAKVAALKAKGPLALMSSDVGLLKREGQAAGEALRTEGRQRAANGQPPLYCPPQGKASIGSNELIAGLQRIPPAQRGMSLKDGMRRVLIAQYPCR